MTDDKLELPGNEQPEQNQDVLEYIDEARKEDVFLQIKTEDKIKGEYMYVTKMYEVKDKEEDNEVFNVVKDKGYNKSNFMSASFLHDFMLEQLEAKILELEELPENKDQYGYNWQETMKRFQEKENPLDNVYVFIRHTSDGRYKDEWKLYRGESEEKIREEKGKPRPDSGEKYVYYCLGTFREVKENKEELAQKHEFNRKEGGGRSIPLDLIALTEKNEIYDVVEYVMDTEPEQAALCGGCGEEYETVEEVENCGCS